MAEWVFEEGIGENRAALIEDGKIVEALIERDERGPRAGSVVWARYQYPVVRHSTASVKVEGGPDILLSPVPRGFGPGTRFKIEIVREFIFSPGRRLKLAKGRAVPEDTPIASGPTLVQRISNSELPMRILRSFEADSLEEAGWSELLEEAASGKVTFPGGSLIIEQTEGMTVIDIDGTLPAEQLAIAGARSAGQAIRRMNLTGSIGIDLPTVNDKDVRKRAGDALDEALGSLKVERTAMNGFGFVQVVRRQERASLLDLLQGEPANAAALRLYRMAEREPRSGGIVIVANHDVVGCFARNARNDAELSRRRGGPVDWEVRNALPLSGSYVAFKEPDYDEE